jgi:hypothetical protein
VLKSYVGPGANAWLFVCIVNYIFLIDFKSFFHYVVHLVRAPPLLTFGLSHCICDKLLDPMGIHLLCCAHGGDSTTSHDVIQEVFSSIARDVRFYILCE